jgi:hypothetical protein
MRWLALSLVLPFVSTLRADDKDQIVAKQRAFALETLKKCDAPTPALIETKDLLVCGPFPEAKLKAMGEPVQKHYAAAFAALKFEMTDNPPPGKLAVYFLPDRKQYNQFSAQVIEERLDRNDRSHADARRPEPYVVVSVLPGKEPTDFEKEASRLVEVGLLQAKAGESSLPPWVEEGFVRALRMRAYPDQAANDRIWLKRNVAGKASRYKVSDTWAPGGEKEKQLLAASVMEFFVYGPGAPKLSKFLIGLRVVDPEAKPTADAALTAASFTADQLDAAWKKWLLIGK